jgi:hypothetical protein
MQAKPVKVNKAKIRREIEQEFAKMFIESGIEYTCGAAVFNYIRPYALAKANELLNQGVNLSKSDYPICFKSLMAGMFQSGALKLVHEYYYPKKG